MSTAAAILLVIIAAACWVGVFAHSYRDNWGQFCGLVLMALWSAGELAVVAGGVTVTPRQLLLYAALAVFIGGTALKVVQFRKRQHRRGQVV